MPEPMSAEQFNRIKSHERGGPPGPWSVEYGHQIRAGTGDLIASSIGHSSNVESERAEHIALAWCDRHALIAEVERLRAREAELEVAMAELTERYGLLSAQHTEVYDDWKRLLAIVQRAELEASLEVKRA